jgi:energy-coupling factor transporter ATP-binding protein EcfA2
VSIARALHFDSDLIVLDEPTNNLGVEETQGVLRFMRRARDTGHSLIFIAHNIHHVFQVVDRIVVLRRGKVVAEDAARWPPSTARPGSERTRRCRPTPHRTWRRSGVTSSARPSRRAKATRPCMAGLPNTSVDGGGGRAAAFCGLS